MLVFGFVLDYVTFKNIRASTALAVLCVHLTFAGASIAFIQFYDEKQIFGQLRFVRLFAPLVAQFTFGALLGGTFIFYWFSASLAASWPFILLLVALIVSNEVLRTHVSKMLVQLGVYYFVVFSFFSIALPYALNNLGPRIFLLAGAASLVFMALYLGALSLARGPVYRARIVIARIALGIFVAMNALYFANIIPPVPLSLRELGVYHAVSREGNSYVLLREPAGWLSRVVARQTIHLAPKEGVYIYSAIFAPADLRTDVFHRWQMYDENLGKWFNKDRLLFRMEGGRKEGFRGYSMKQHVDPGLWRVWVETAQGQVLGRVQFQVERSSGDVAVEEVVR